MEKIILLFLLTSCVTTQQKLDPLVFYSRDMGLNVNGYKSSGTIVVPKNNKYKIKLNPPGYAKMDFIILKTCHKEISVEKAGRKETIWHEPNVGIEDTGLCMAEISALEHKLGRHSFANIDFESDLFQLPSLVKCNGNTYNSRGTTICQSKEGLVQVIEFPEEVIPATTGKCGVLPSVDNKTFKYKTPNRICSFIFKGKVSGKFAKLTTIGYERLAIRKLK